MTELREQMEWEEGKVVPTRSIGLTQKEMVMEMRDEMREVRTDLTYLRGQMDVLLSQKHDSRIEDLERWRYKADGRLDLIVRGVPFLSAVLAILATLGGWVIFGGV